MKEFKILKFLDKFKGVFKSLGVDYEIMRKIVQLKLTIDGRRVPTILNNSNKKENSDGNKFLKSLWIYFLFGLMLVVLVISKRNIMYQMSIFFGIFMFMIMTTFISDFSSVLLDVRDKNIILSKPVNSKTINAAKMVHVLIYMSYITLSMTALPLIVSLRQGAPFFIILFLEIILVDLFMVVITALLYFLILKFFDGEKLKDIINYVQIALSLIVTVGYQLIGRMFSIIDAKAVFTPKWWQYLIPPIWFAAPLQLVTTKGYSSYFVSFSILAIVIPIISILIYIKLVPVFEENLQKLNNHSSKENKNKIEYILAKILCRDTVEKTFFKFTCNMLKNERKFKLKVYPSIGLSLVFPFLFMFSTLRETNSFNSWLNYMASTKYYVNIYFSIMLIPNIVMMMKYSEKSKGAWIYKAMPIREVAPIFKGTLKAFMAKLILPLYLVESIIFIFIFTPKVIPHLVAAFLACIIFIVACFSSFDKILPFSKDFNFGQNGENATAFVLTLVLLILAGIHYGITYVRYGIYGYVAVLFIADIYLWKKSFNISWEKVNG